MIQQATAKKSRRTTEPKTNGEAAKPAPQLSEAAQTIESSCMEFRMSVRWLELNKKVDKHSAEKMTATVNARREGVSLTKRLFSAKTEAMQKANAARGRLTQLRDAWTIPKAMLCTKVGDEPEKDPGIRLIRIADIDEFDELLNAAIADLMTSIAVLQDDLEKIKEADKERLGDLYDDADYPDDVTEYVEVVKGYQPIMYTEDFRILAPATYKKELARTQQMFEDTANLAATTFAKTFLAQVKTLCNQLGNRTRLNPPKDHPQAYLKDAEVVTFQDHDTDPETIEPGQVQVELRYKPAGEEKNVTHWFNMTEKEFEEFRPYKTDEKRKISESSVVGLMDSFDTFRKLGEYAGAHASKIEGAIAEVKSKLEKVAGGDYSVVADELRKSKFFRNEMESQLTVVADSLKAVVVDVKKCRRRVNKDLMGKTST